MAHSAFISGDTALQEREARGLRVPIAVRLLFCLYWLVQLLELGEPRSFPIALVVLACTATIGLWFLNEPKRAEAVGLAGAFIDVGLLFAYAVYAPTAEDAPVDMLAFVAVTLVAINGLALRPLYPLVVAAGAVTVVLSRAPSLDIIVLVGVLAASVAFIAYSSRQTVRDAIELELANQRIREEQLAVIMREKASALGQLVAGVSHELNTPLGALRSSLDTVSRALTKVSNSVNPDDAKAQVGLQVARRMVENAQEGASRIEQVGRNLRGFTQLDRAQLVEVDVTTVVAQVVELVATSLRQGVRVELSEEPIISTCNVRGISQVLFTIVQNAFEAVENRGTVSVDVKTQHAEVVVTVRDDGPGLAPEQISDLFEVSLQEGRARFGLATARSFLCGIGGRVTATSQPHRGAVLEVSWPR